VCGDGGSAVIPGCDDDDTGVGDSTTATNKKGANMTERVPVPSSEHVAEIVGRQGKFVQVRWSAVGLIDTEFRDAMLLPIRCFFRSEVEMMHFPVYLSK